MSLSALTQKKLGKEKGQTNWYRLDQCNYIQTYIPKIAIAKRTKKIQFCHI